MKRGRKSAADLSVVPIAPRVGRPKPPPELTAEQAEEWKAIVAKMPPDWFGREHHGILAAFCRHRVRARFLSQELDRFRPEWLREDGGPARYDKLAAAAERETRALLACARAMRLTHQSRYDAAKAARDSRRDHSGPKPWEPDFTRDRDADGTSGP